MKHKVLFFIESLSGGGAEQVLVTLLRHLNYSRFEVTLMTVADVGVHLKDIDYRHIHYRTMIPQGKSFLPKLWYKLKYKLIYHFLPTSFVARFMIPNGYDTYVAFVEGYCTKILAHLPTNAGKVAWVHIDLKNYPWTQNAGIYRNLGEEIKCYTQYDTVVCVSHSVEEIMRSYYLLDNTIVIYNPIDVSRIRKLAEMDSEVVIPSKGFNLVSVGRLVIQKGYDLLIPMIARLRDEGLDVSLYILGEGECRDSLELLIRQYNLNEFVHLLGYRSNPYAIVDKMDLFVCSSRAEGYSLVIAESLALGVPVISTLCAGPNELIDNNKNGILCENYEILYYEIKNIIENPELLSQLRQKAINRKEVVDMRRNINLVEKILVECQM